MSVAVIAALLGLATVVAIIRLAIAPSAGVRPWRLAALTALQPLAAGLLYFTLEPPPSPYAQSVLTVATTGAPVAAGGRVIALPEAPAMAGRERVPDLATAIRRIAPAQLRVIGAGLTARDRDAVDSLPLDFDPTPAPHGLIALSPPPVVAAGAAFRVGGEVGGIAHAVIELIDPAGRHVDTATTGATGNFTLNGTARTPGPALFTVRVHAGARLVEDAALPVWVAAAAASRILLLAGAPGPEIKYLRRWASDTGLRVHAEVATGAGLALGDASLPLTPATLRPFDLVIVDGRSWTALSPAARATVRAAVRGGLGLIVRLDGPSTAASRAAATALGFAVADSDAAVMLPVPTADDAAQAARSGPGTVDAPATVNAGAALPPLTRTAIVTGAGTTPLLRDGRGATIAAWRADGVGRIALWPLADSFRLVLAGRSDVFGELWSSAVTTIGRSNPAKAPHWDSPAWLGQRVTLCGGGTDTAVVDPRGGGTPLLADPATPSCAGFWPTVVGWHRLVGPSQTAAPFYVYPADGLPGVRAMTDRAATLALVGRTAAANVSGGGQTSFPGSPWPWFLTWLATSALLWWLERSRPARDASVVAVGSADAGLSARR